MNFNPLEKLKIEYWYHAFSVVGAFVFIMSLCFKLTVDNRKVQLISLGVFLLSIGEWINHPLFEQPCRGPGFTGKWIFHPRRVSFFGGAIEVLGGILILLGILKLCI
jgi:hypothetical protein